MALLSENTETTLKEFWITLSGWNEIRQFGKIFFFILRKPFRHTIQIYKTIEQHDSFKFYVQSFVIFTIITSLITAFKGNDILKSIFLMLNQFVFLLLSTLLCFLFFNRISEIKRNFSEFLKLYSLYMGFILPFFALGFLLNWQVILFITDPEIGKTAPNPAIFIPTLLGALGLSFFGLYYSTRIIRYFWNIHYLLIIFGLIMVFIVLTPLQRTWIQLQCKMGIIPEFEFNNLEHRKATYEILGCEDVACKKCLLIGVWKYTDSSIQKEREHIYKNKLIESNLVPSNINDDTIEKAINKLKGSRIEFNETHFTLKYDDSLALAPNTSTPWYLSDDGKNIFVNNTRFQLIDLKKDFVILSFEASRSDNSKYNDTFSLEPAIKKD